SLFSGEFLGGVAYGIHVSIFATTAYFMTQNKSWRKAPRVLFGVACILFILGTIIIATNTKLMEQAFIDDRNIPGGPLGWLEQYYGEPLVIFGNAAYITANFLADGLLIYRLLVLWDYNHYIMTIPVLSYLGSTALSILTLFQAARPGSTLATHNTVVFAVPYWSLSISLNLLVTLLIVLRLLMWRSKVIGVLGPQHSKTYTSIAAMMIESAALFSVAGLIFIICFARQSHVQNLILPVLGQIMCMSPELIIMRVALGRAWSRDT
ncbi:hypothetical protein BD410DRAFT_695577, partial [Rickenella mellea]